MYIPVWLVILVVTPFVLYAVYVLMLFATLAGMHAIIGMAKLGKSLSSDLAVIFPPLLSPFRHVGPWFDYAVVTSMLVVLSCGIVLWLAA